MFGNDKWIFWVALMLVLLMALGYAVLYFVYRSAGEVSVEEGIPCASVDDCVEVECGGGNTAFCKNMIRCFTTPCPTEYRCTCPAG